MHRMRLNGSYPNAQNNKQTMANLDGQWKAVNSNRSRSKSLSEQAGQRQQAAKTKSARKNARRKERRQFEKKWGVSVEEAAALEESGGAADGEEGGQGRMRSQSLIDQTTNIHSTLLPCDDDEALLRRVLEASLAEANECAGHNPDDDVRNKRLRNLKKKISAAEALRSVPTSDLDAGQKAKLERLSSLISEATTIKNEFSHRRQLLACACWAY